MTRLLDCNVFIFSYRGYGRSQGTPSEQVRKPAAPACLAAWLAASQAAAGITLARPCFIARHATLSCFSSSPPHRK